MEKKNLVMVVLCVAIGIMAVAYAAFSTTLTVTGTITTEGNFSVIFTGGECIATRTAGTTAPSARVVVDANDATKATIEDIMLYAPGDDANDLDGDTLQCTINVKNDGDFKAKLDGAVALTPATLSEESRPVAAWVVSATEKLAKDTEGSIVIKIMYNYGDSATEKDDPTTKSYDFTVTAGYTQDLA